MLDGKHSLSVYAALLASGHVIPHTHPPPASCRLLTTSHSEKYANTSDAYCILVPFIVSNSGNNCSSTLISFHLHPPTPFAFFSLQMREMTQWRTEDHCRLSTGSAICGAEAITSGLIRSESRQRFRKQVIPRFPQNKTSLSKKTLSQRAHEKMPNVTISGKVTFPPFPHCNPIFFFVRLMFWSNAFIAEICI